MPIAVADIMEVLWGREGEISGTYWWNRVGIISTIIWAGQISADLASSSLSMRSSLLLPAASSIIPTEIADIIGEGCWGRGAEISGESDGIERLDHGNELGSVRCQMLVDESSEVVSLSLQQNVVREVRARYVFRNNQPLDTNNRVQFSIRINRQSQELDHEICLKAIV